MELFKNLNNLEYREQPVSLGLSPFECFKRIYAQSENCFFLESLGDTDLYSRFAYIGFDPEICIDSPQGYFPFHGVARLRGNDNEERGNDRENFYQEIAKLSQIKVSHLPQKGFAGGLVGYFGHEAAGYFDPAFVVGAHPDFPDFELGLYLDGLVFDRIAGRESYFTVRENRFEHIKKLLQKPIKNAPFLAKLTSISKTKEQHKQMVLSAQKHIAAGDIFQVVLSIGHEYEVSGDPIAVYTHLRRINPSPHMTFFKFGSRIIMGASPELLIDVEGSVIRHRGTLAGTIHRGKDDVKDTLLAHQLLSDEKEKAEHMMLVDLARNDMGRVCDFGSISVDHLLQVKKFSHVQHLSSEIRGILNKGENAFTALDACFPAGTLSGAPKIEAMKIIHKLENAARGPYGGVEGYVSFNGSTMQCINIRSFAVSGKKGFMQVGSGIVNDSDPDKEYQEIVNKGKAMEEALEMSSRT